MSPSLSLGSFYGADSFLDLMIVLVSILISYQSIRVYGIINEKKYKFFSWSFALIGISFIFKIIYNLTILYEVALRNPSFISFIFEELENTEILHFVSFILFKFFILTGFLTLFLIVKKRENAADIFLLLYLGLIVVLFSIYFNIMFYITTIIILLYLTNHFYKNYQKFHSESSRLVFLAFLFILISQIIYLFYRLHPLIYLFGEMVLFTGFVILLINHTRIKNAEKENKTRSGKRHR